MWPGARRQTRAGKIELADGAGTARSPDRPESLAFFYSSEIL